MKAHERLPTLDEIKDCARTMRAKEQAVARCPEDESVEHSFTKIMGVLAAAAIHQTHKNVFAARDAVDNIKRHVAAKEMRITALEQGAKSLQELVRELAAIRQSDKEELQAKLEAAESEAARLELMAMEGDEALARERENSARIKLESDATREENQGLRMQIDAIKNIALDTLRRLPKLDELDKWHALEALRKAVE